MTLRAMLDDRRNQLPAILDAATAALTKHIQQEPERLDQDLTELHLVKKPKHREGIGAIIRVDYNMTPIAFLELDLCNMEVTSHDIFPDSEGADDERLIDVLRISEELGVGVMITAEHAKRFREMIEDDSRLITENCQGKVDPFDRLPEVDDSRTRKQAEA